MNFIAFAAIMLAMKSTQCISQNYRFKNILEPDVIRNTYLQVEKSLWDGTVNNDRMDENSRLKSIIDDHNNFVNTFLKDYVDIDDLKMLINLSGWKTLLSNVINIHRMFVSFQQHLNRESKYDAKGGFDEEVTIDLVQHILDDSHWPLSEAIENLHKITVHDELYFRDNMVNK